MEWQVTSVTALNLAIFSEYTSWLQNVLNSTAMPHHQPAFPPPSPIYHQTHYLSSHPAHRSPRVPASSQRLRPPLTSAARCNTSRSARSCQPCLYTPRPPPTAQPAVWPGTPLAPACRGSASRQCPACRGSPGRLRP